MRTFLLNPHRSLSIALRVLLIVSLWEGPVLWGHHHSPGFIGLSEHLEQFHPGLETRSPPQSEWHWHLSWPESPEPCEEGRKESTPRSRNLTAATSIVTAHSWSVQLSICVGDVSFIGHPEPRRIFSLQEDRAFLATYCPAHSMQQLLCRMSC